MLPTPWFTRWIGLRYFEITCHRSKNCCPHSLKSGNLYICLPAEALLFKYVSFLSIYRDFEPFQCWRTFSSISGITTSWRAINNDYPVHAQVDNLIVFPPNWVFLVILLLKSTYFFLWKLGELQLNFDTLKSLAVGKKSQFATVLHSEVLATLLIWWIHYWYTTLNWCNILYWFSTFIYTSQWYFWFI